MKPFRLIASLIPASLLAATSVAFAQDRESIEILFVPFGVSREVMPAIHAGARKAMEDIERANVDVAIFWKDSGAASFREQNILMVDTYTGQRLSGILSALVTPSKSANSTKWSGYANLPTMTLSSPLDSGCPSSFVSTDNFQGGEIAADRVAALIRDEGNVIMLRDKAGVMTSEAIEAGFLDRIKSAYLSVRVISMDRREGNSSADTYGTCEELLNRYGQRVNAIFCSSRGGAESMLRAMKVFDLIGEVYFVSFQFSKTIVEATRKGEAHGFVAYDPFRMGYASVTAVVERTQGGSTATSIPQDLRMITHENVGDPDVEYLLSSNYGF